ncbi:MAG: hypothetical protein MJZ16_09470 [Bacteroidales bacterium]|nr:hypothetical protein [Bacteroidales bacterium]
MKKLLSLLLLALCLIAAQGCESIFGDTYSAKVTTLDATDISLEGYTFNASIDWKGNPAITGEGGVFYGPTAGISAKNSKFSCALIDLHDGINQVHATQKNYNVAILKDYYFKAGQTVYYRAFAKVFTAEGEMEFIYGEEKSFVIPE